MPFYNHRKIENFLFENCGAKIEQRIILPDGTVVRKDAVMPNGTLIIIKPDTPSGHKAADRRKNLLMKNGYDKDEIKFIFYDPEDPKYQPGSSTYIGPKKK